MNKTQSNGDITQSEAPRKTLYKNALLTFAGKPAAKVRTTDISYFDVYVVSPVHAKQKTRCKLDLAIPITPEEDEVFQLKCEVISSVYSNSNNGFLVGLSFLSPSANILQRIKLLK